MSFAFDKFMEQYKSIGSQKADGYTIDMLIGLEDAEKLEIFRLLQTELPWSAQWLFFVNPEKATVIARELEAKWRGHPYRRVDWLQKELIKYAGDMIFQDHMMEDYAHYIDKLRPAVVDSIGSTPTTEAKLKFLEEVILVEVVDYAVMAAIRNLLFSIKFPRETEADERNYKRLINELRNGNVEVKLRALAEIRKCTTAILSSTQRSIEVRSRLLQ